MNLTLIEYFLIFLIYSFLGWCMETLTISIQNKKFVNRGFLIGPYCPIYGCGALFIIILLNRYSYDPLVLFVMTIISCGILEYLTSWAMEVTFKARWWDYSDKKFNLNGRVCLTNLIAFGVLGLIVNYILNPFFIDLLQKVNESNLKWISITLACFYIIDCVISFIVIFSFRKVTKTVNNERKEDNTEQITKMVKDLFSQKSFLHRRFINAYPKLEAIKTKIKEIKEKIEDVTNDAKDVVTEKTEHIKETINRGTREAKATVYLNKKKIKSNLKGKINDFKLK